MLSLKKFRLFIVTYVAVALFSISFAVIFSPDLKERIINKTVGQLEVNNQLFLFSNYHERIFKTGYNIFLDKPLIGHGPKLFRNLCVEDKFYVEGGGCSTHPHNIYIQLLAETGLLGAAPVILIFTILSYLILRQFVSVNFNFSSIRFDDSSICLIIAIFIIVSISINGKISNCIIP